MDHLFFIDRGASAQPAKRICAACPVINECLDYALRTSAREGIWGGLSERERRKVKQQRRREAS
jgi:WhiB family redox-sensing transcriptional regulator